MPKISSGRLRKVVLPGALLMGDTFLSFGGLNIGYWLRYDSPLNRWGLDVSAARYSDYLPLLCLGVAFLIAAFAHLGLYESQWVLRKFQSLNLIMKGTAFWLVAYLGLSLTLKFDPPISRLFVVIAAACVLSLLFAWRTGFHFALTRSRWHARLRQQVAVLGWNEEARALTSELSLHAAHSYHLLGVVSLPGEDLPPNALGNFEELTATLTRHQVDVLIATRTDLPREQLLHVVDACERTYVEWKVVPNAFQILLSGLRLQTIGRMPVLGIEDLAITRLFNRGFKRLVDIVGAIIGLLFAVPCIAILAVLIKLESPGGSVFFQQTRVGARHRPFTLYKLRSMLPGAEALDEANQSTLAKDRRLLNIGSLMRTWNFDELPQFWNVLWGDMSLVGPRPERPYHVELLASAIPHYLPRHLAKPGMTGWAQVNGLRGDTSMERRIQHDIYYIENWSPWLDLQILALTFGRWKNPST